MRNIFQEVIVSVLSDIPSKHAAWLDTIKGQDDLMALESATQGLMFAMSDKSLNIRTLSKIIDYTAQTTSPILARLSQQFIRFELMNSNIENNILTVAYAFHKQLYSDYITLLNYFYNDPKQHKKELVHRYMYAAVNQAFEMLRWRSFVNLGLAPKIWLQLHKILAIADSNKLLNQPLIDVTNHSSNHPSLGSLLVQTYMLDTLQQANLSRLAIDIVCKLLRSQLLDVEISSELDPTKSLFYVNLEKDIGAKRIRLMNAADHCVYWQIDALEKTIVKKIHEISGKSLEHEKPLEPASENPAESQFVIEPYQIKTATETFGLLLREWSRHHYVRQRRKEIRRKITTIANVVHGIRDVTARVKANENSKFTLSSKLSTDGRSLEQRPRGQASIKGISNTPNTDIVNHHWVIIDESNQGLGAIASKELNTRTTVGQLVGLITADAKQDLIIAVIRSIRPKTNRQMQVGIEILSRHAKCVQLKPVRPDIVGDEQVQYNSTNAADMPDFIGLYLPIEAGLSPKSMLILPRIEFIPYTHYEISIAGMLDQVMLGESIESRNDWIKISYPR